MAVRNYESILTSEATGKCIFTIQIDPFCLLFYGGTHSTLRVTASCHACLWIWSAEKMLHILWILFLLLFGLSPGTQRGHISFLSHMKWGKEMTDIDLGQCHHCWRFYAAMNSKQNWVVGYFVCRVEFVFIRYIPWAKRKSRYSSSYHKPPLSLFLLLFSQRNQNYYKQRCTYSQIYLFKGILR